MLFSKMCFCGKTQKNFKVDIGPHHLAECCEIAGYDHLGNLPKKKAEKKEGPTRPYKPSGKYSKKNKVTDQPETPEEDGQS